MTDNYAQEIIDSRKAADFITKSRGSKPKDSQMNYVLSKYGNPNAHKASVEDFASNPGSFGFSRVSFNEAQPGDVFISNENGIPMEAVIFTGKKDNEGYPLFDYIDWTKGDSEVKGGRFLDPRYFNENIFTVYRQKK